MSSLTQPVNAELLAVTAERPGPKQGAAETRSPASELMQLTCTLAFLGMNYCDFVQYDQEKLAITQI
jgi:hypothetical protein